MVWFPDVMMTCLDWTWGHRECSGRGDAIGSDRSGTLSALERCVRTGRCSASQGCDCSETEAVC